MSSSGLEPVTLELAILDTEGRVLHARGLVVDSHKRVAELISDPDVKGYSRGDLVQYRTVPDHPFPLITARLAPTDTAAIVSLKPIRDV